MKKLIKKRFFVFVVSLSVLAILVTTAYGIWMSRVTSPANTLGISTVGLEASSDGGITWSTELPQIWDVPALVESESYASPEILLRNPNPDATIEGILAFNADCTYIQGPGDGAEETTKLADLVHFELVSNGVVIGETALLKDNNSNGAHDLGDFCESIVYDASSECYIPWEDNIVVMTLTPNEGMDSYPDLANDQLSFDMIFTLR